MTLTPKEKDGLIRLHEHVGQDPLLGLADCHVCKLLATLAEAQLKADALREDLMRCGSLAVSDRLDGSLGKRRADRITEIVWAACWPETKR